MKLDRQAIRQYIDQNSSRFLEELKCFLAIPSVSTNPERRPDIGHAADWLSEHLKGLGMSRIEIFPTSGHPIVYAESEGAGEDSVLIYGHYDVQPADPHTLWESGPFEPSVRGDNLYARGASDMKGQIIASLKAVAGLKHGLPVPVKFLLEGEEEIGSPNLKKFIKEHKDMLACRFSLNPDAGMISPDLPTITYALRGLAYFEIRLRGPVHDLHSGSFGGVVHNPAQVLCELIAGMHDEQGRVTLPGFYDNVLPLKPSEREELSHLPMDDKHYLEQSGAPELWGEKGYTSAERIGARPTLEINGLLSGFTGEGSKTVLPSEAMAKISMRLVPNQNPDDIAEQLEKYLKATAPASVKWEVIKLASGPASICDRESTGIQALSRALETVWGKKPLFKREGGSIPVVSYIKEVLNADSLLTGFGLPDDNVHAPNEKLHLPTWYRGIEALMHFFLNLKN